MGSKLMDIPPKPSATSRASSILAGFVLLLTAGLALVWSHGRLMEQDEFLSFYSDSVATVRGVIDVQLHTPISLDPPTYHLLSHFTMDALGRNAMALRLPALGGFLLMELALFFLVRRLAGGRAGVIAMALPLLSASFRYAVEGRPYGLLLGLYAAAFLCWYVAATRRERSRVWPLAGLAVSIALAITSHYFGILILVPVVAGELARIASRKRMDWPVAAAMTIGFAAVALILPFQKALAPYRKHYYISGVSVRAVTQGYRELFVTYNHWPMALQRAIAALLAVSTIALVFYGWRRYKQRPASEPAWLWAGLLAFATLPFFSFLFGRFVTHTMEVRYVIATLIPFAVILALLAAPRLQRSGAFFYGLLAMVLGAATISSVVQIRAVRTEARVELASLATPAAVSDRFSKDANAKLYTQSLANFYLVGYYSPDPEVRKRLTLVYDNDREIAWLKHNTNAVTAEYMVHFTSLPVATFCDFVQQPEALVVSYNDAWVWLGKEIAADRLPAIDVQPAYLGELQRVSGRDVCQGER